ncbi:hypothetical protein RF11_13750 [Thelohanellus kitauei]|uniref:Uncharacterized protein n=1 Tax=Thelohanellus kitauei TaxID=669202 RepID=A0A0C2MM72_THEKT|nr:hypothetical protein RF11_13750 [Thelohanellus kitauei]
MFRVIETDCLGNSGIIYPTGDFVRIRDSKKGDLCYCGHDSRMKCDYYISCRSLKCKSGNSVVKECCSDLKCADSEINRYNPVIIFAIIFVAVVSAILLIPMCLALYFCWCRRSKPVIYEIERFNIGTEESKSSTLLFKKGPIAENLDKQRQAINLQLKFLRLWVHISKKLNPS